ncbi:MAG: 50S ribosomal protein L32e [Candidatus Aenigmarchaeota archaeon]
MKEEMLELRKKIKKKKPKFRRQEWFRKKALGEKWRKPRGLHSKLRMHEKAKGSLPKPGYGSPASVRGLNREGYREVLVKNTKDLEKINPKEEIAIIASGVGKKKRFEIFELAGKNNIKVGNYKFI